MKKNIDDEKEEKNVFKTQHTQKKHDNLTHTQKKN